MGVAYDAMDDEVRGFYDGFAADYDLAYEDWDEAVERQGRALDRVIRARVADAADVLDCACGIGTQAIGLALRGYRVHGTDLSAEPVARARREAERLGAEVSFGLADFRDLSGVPGTYDAVICCDNALPHLLETDDVVRALREMRAKLRPGGVLVVTLRDFDEALESRPALRPTVLDPGPPRRVLVRMHDWDDERPEYVVRYVILTETNTGWSARELSMRYRAYTSAETEAAARAAGFDEVEWVSDEEKAGLAHCVLVATRLPA
jgi:SAM-dependent methyltransferase